MDFQVGLQGKDLGAHMGQSPPGPEPPLEGTIVNMSCWKVKKLSQK